MDPANMNSDPLLIPIKLGIPLTTDPQYSGYFGHMHTDEYKGVVTAIGQWQMLYHMIYHLCSMSANAQYHFMRMTNKIRNVTVLT